LWSTPGCPSPQEDRPRLREIEDQPELHERLVEAMAADTYADWFVKKHQ
jgi:hypothetical protein